MKITGIEIGEYRQFKNIKFDFTYPEGHPKAGQPLEKICFIGQSGTGKTTLLNAIWHFFLVIDDGYQALSKQRVVHGLSYPYRTFKDLIISAKINGREIIFGNSSFEKIIEIADEQVRNVHNILSWIKETDIYNDIDVINKLCLYIDDSSSTHAYGLTANKKGDIIDDRPFVTTADEIFLMNEKRSEAIERLSISKVTGLSTSERSALWPYLLGDIDRYDEGLNKVISSLIQRHGFSKSKFDETYNKWLSENPNLRIQIAEKCLNPILKYFF